MGKNMYRISETPEETRRELQQAGRYMLANGLAWGNAGNLSARLGPELGLITASGTRMGELADDDFAEFAIGPGAAPAHGRKPSKEVPMHRAVYQARPDVNAILHASPFYSTLVACAGAGLPTDLFVEDMYYLERVARVAYAQPGTAQLGELVGAQAARANVLLLENHGVLVYDTSVKEALMALHTLEMTARMVVTARSAGLELQSLPSATVAEFLERSGYRPRRQWPAEDAK
jgi:ribulose-5-phosphate 4-epimerase/fuculose-1-phosphate aldolase